MEDTSSEELITKLSEWKPMVPAQSCPFPLQKESGNQSSLSVVYTLTDL